MTAIISSHLLGNDSFCLDSRHCPAARRVTQHVSMMQKSRPGSSAVFGEGTGVVGCYYPGVGLAGSPDLAGFTNYLVNGATANDIQDRISTTDPAVTFDDMCRKVYRMYRSRDDEYKPGSTYVEEFKADFSHVRQKDKPLIKFMGLFDTVGSLGVPMVAAGIGLEYEFYDQRFVPFRTTGGLLERAAHSILDVTDLLGINIEPTLECSVTALEWMLSCVAKTDRTLLDRGEREKVIERCMKEEPLQYHIPFFPRALKKNAFDELADRFFGKLSPFTALGLRDRDIPVYSGANFISPTSEASEPPGISLRASTLGTKLQERSAEARTCKATSAQLSGPDRVQCHSSCRRPALPRAASSDLASATTFSVGKDVIGCFFQGIGLAGSPNFAGFETYLVNGAVADDIADKCIAAYKMIVCNWKEGSEVWMTGLSRGAFTIRSVAGMINNWGILDRSQPAVAAQLDEFCCALYRHYRSRDAQYVPGSPYVAEYQAKYCHKLQGRPPIKFMGLLDTVGALGVPNLAAGIGVSYEFYDQFVSSSVENVYQALACHDRLSVFEPCFARRTKPGPGVTKEVWFPGAHYDIGRQRFVPFRTTGGLLERAAHRVCDVTNLGGIDIEPTKTCSHAVLKWMLQCMADTDAALVDPAQRDAVLGRCLQAGPDGLFIFPALMQNAYDIVCKRVFGKLSPFTNIALRDRDIPLYSDANFHSNAANAPNAGSFVSPGSGFRSRAFNTYVAQRPGGVLWVA
ncbi:hypothetical protein WJX81_005492 [Elliptochloris bilobata]|uniref:T6SS Phospholipase effector Tle1-like catalytic domain-containing protein n=1 Tax=Elliptochloris bilobata TaxID=381761 RepID=A0AAW1SJ51_9CHLO